MTSPSDDARSFAGRVASRVFPNLDEWQFNRGRDREIRQRIKDAGYEQALGPARALTPSAAERPVHVVVVAMDGPESGNFAPAGGNFFYEIAQAARETIGAERVSVFCVEPDESAFQWHVRLVQYVLEVGATHLIAQVEKDPGVHKADWTWDVLWAVLEPRWDGVLLGVMFDSSFRWLVIPVRRLGRMSDRFVLVDICMPMDGSMVKGRVEVGPVNMPVSNQTLEIVDAAAEGRPKVHDVTFIGALYPYRVELIDALQREGLRVAVNPHRTEAAHDLDSSRENLPTYIDYMVALAQSHMTINFSQSSAGPYQQLKTRVLEASAMGCLVLTDDQDRTERFWVKGQEFDYFATPGDLTGIVKTWLSDPERLAAAQAAAKTRARSMNSSGFWRAIDAGLRARGLPAVIA